MRIGIVGLGLIGGSMAKALKAYTPHEVLGFDKNASVLEAAKKENAIDGVLTKDGLSSCEFLLIALYPAAGVEYVRAHQDEIPKQCIVMDLCGVKRAVCEPLTEIAAKQGFRYIGGHPMAGTEKTGFANTRAELFQNASMILVPCRTDEDAMQRAAQFAKEVGFSRITPSTIEAHDRIIAYTSQLAHVVSNAYVKSPTALLHHGFSAGSYRDLTRVAWLNEEMWTELFLDNAEPLAEEIDGLIDRLSSYRDAILNGEREALRTLLREGRERKERIDRNNL